MKNIWKAFKSIVKKILLFLLTMKARADELEFQQALRDPRFIRKYKRRLTEKYPLATEQEINAHIAMEIQRNKRPNDLIYDPYLESK